ncbi:MAG: hypothetical protein PHV49_00395 [Alistipes sp.]|nr:hypothetical protein [Alistipes sp.]
MKKFLTFLGVLLGVVLWATPSSVSAQPNTVLDLKDGSQIEGYLRSPLHSTVQYVELSSEPIGKTKRYEIGNIERITMTDLEGNKTRFVKEIRYRMFKDHSDKRTNKGRYRNPVLFREDYRGLDGIAMLSEFRETEATTAMRSFVQKEHWYYVKLKDEPYVRVIGVETPKDTPGAKEANFKRFASNAFEQYPELVERIKNNEFSFHNPVEVVKAYEKIVAY